MSTTVTLYVPPNSPFAGGNSWQLADGSVAPIDSAGRFTAPAADLPTLIAAGCTLTPQVGTMAQRPAAVPPGYQYFDSTLGKPIWRNAAGSGWADATGASV